jgi:transposase InsO family protein
MSASAFRYAPRPDRNVELREQIVALAQRHKRYGVGMIHLKLRQAGMLVNYKRVERLYQDAKLQVRRRKRKKVLIGERQPLYRPLAANEVWSMDFVFDRTAEGRVLKCLTVVDDATHEAVAIEVERAISGHGVARVLDRLALSRGLPKVIRTDNGKEFCGKAMVQWAYQRGVHLAADRTRQAEPERLHRKLQRPTARRMPQRALVPEPAAGACRDRNMATRIQRRATEKGPWWDDPRGLCEAF